MTDNLTPPIDTTASLPTSWVVMGVSGCGKSEIGQRLANRLAIPYVEGDDDHPAANIKKMGAGIALDDADRLQWLLVLQKRIADAASSGNGIVLSCSSLKRRYRDLLRLGDPALVFVHLQGERALIASRMAARPGHFMPLTLLDSQFRDLEPLALDEPGVCVDIRKAPQVLVDDIVHAYAPRLKTIERSPT